VARQILDIEGVAKMLYFLNKEGRPNRNIIYKLVRRPVDPLPHRKVGKHLRFDVEKCWKWFDRQPGKDGEDIYEEDI